MNRTYWEKIAPGYDEEIFDVLHNDKKAIIRKAIQKLAKPTGSVIDIGCAIGKWLPVLAPAFRQVMAVDISAKNLAIAKKRYPGFTNVHYERADMSKGNTPFKGFDLAICINAILTDSLAKRTVFFKNLAACVKKGGSVILVVPSLESWLKTRIIQQQFGIDRSLFNDKLSDALAAQRYRLLLQGNVEIDNVATKHYLGDELQLLLEREGLQADSPKKIQYGWETEFVNPPEWLKAPGPWDWMIQAKKIS